VAADKCCPVTGAEDAKSDIGETKDDTPIIKEASHQTVSAREQA
jgi:hypothetical protein